MKRIILATMSALLMSACTDYLGQLEDDYKATGGDFQGTFIDVDGRAYKTVTIGKQTWLAENLNYAGAENNVECFYDYELPNMNLCASFGRLYSWKQAVMACPDGWDLPTESDVIELSNALKEKYGDFISSVKADYSWEDDDTGIDYNGTNASGFELIPTGYYAEGDFYEFQESGFFWTQSSDFYTFDDGSYEKGNIAFGVNRNDNADEYYHIPEYYIKQTADYRLPIRCLMKK